MRVRHTAYEWTLLFLLVVMWGTSFLFTKIAVASVPPATLVALRLSIAAIVLTVIAYVAGLRLPPPGAIWFRFFSLGFVGNAVPFFLISWGQERIDSGLAGILMAIMPLATLVLAHFWVHGEHMTRRKLAGFALGFVGIVVLTGPEALVQLGGTATDIARQLAVLGGALCYAVNAIMARRLPAMHVLVVSAGVTLMASALMVPVAVIVDVPWRLSPSALSAAAAVWLGLVSTATATIVYFRIIISAGPTFLSLINYLIPVVALVAGVVILGEQPPLSSVTALVIILSGVAMSQLQKPRQPASGKRTN
jgi:drug/metabolite transporter (DMT)-like permease